MRLKRWLVKYVGMHGKRHVIATQVLMDGLHAMGLGA